jgi:hypothetical protein
VRLGSALVLLLWLPWGQAAQIASFQVGDSGWHLGTLGVGKLTSAPGRQIVIPHRDSTGTWWLDAFTYSGQRLPGFPYAAGGDPINVSPTLYDLDHDGLDEIIFTRGTHVIALRGDGSLMWSNTVNAASYVPNGGYQTVTGGFYWYPSGAWMSHLPSTAVFSSQVSPPIVMDLNGTGNYEVVTAWKIQPDPTGAGQDYNPFIAPICGSGPWGTVGENWSGGVVFFDANTGRQNFAYHIHQLVESGLAIGKANPTGPLNVYELNDADCVVAFDKSQPFGLWGKGQLHKQFGKGQRLIPGSYEVPIDVYTADLDGDGLDECLVATTQLSTLLQPSETVLDDDGALLWRRWLPTVSYANNYGWLNSACLIPCNPDHDNHADVLGWNHSTQLTFRYWNGVELVDHPGWPKDFAPYLPTPPVVGDVDGDGAEEIVIGTYNPSVTPSTGQLLIYALDGTLKQSVSVPGGLKHIPALADVEGNGHLDVVFRSLTGQVYIYNFGATTTNLVSWATHRGNMHRDGNCGVSLYPPGTPLVTHKTSGYNRASFTWSNATPAHCYRIFRAPQAAGPFQQVATVTAGTTSYTDYGLQPGWQYFYVVGAVYTTNTVFSPPVAVLSLFNSNLVANAGFEENDNSHWDKWYDDPLYMTNMFGSTTVAFQGRQAMQVLLQNQTSRNTIGQFNQYGTPDSTIYTTPGTFYSYGGWFKSTGLSQVSEHWLQWTSTKTGYDTNNRPALPYPYYFTPHAVFGTTNTDWTYENRTFQLPAGFPNIELAHSFSVPAAASGSLYLDNLFFRQIPAPNSAAWTALVPFGSTWRYLTNPPPANWFTTSFNDAAWPSGKAKLGNGSGPTNLVTRLTQWQSNYFFRTRFTLPATNYEELLLSAICTDVNPLRLWLNGTEIKSTLDVVTLAGNETRYFDLTPFIGLLVPGTNTLAAQLPNTRGSDYDDIAFDLSLKAVACHPVVPRLTMQCTNVLSPMLSVETPTNTVWELQSCDLLGSTNWQVMLTFTNLAGGMQSFSDMGQGGRPLPANVRGRYYRLVPY